MKYMGQIDNDYDLVNKKYVDDKAFRIVATYQSGTDEWTLDKTFLEISEAYNSGAFVYIQEGDSYPSKIYPATAYGDDQGDGYIRFEGWEQDLLLRVWTVNSDDTVEVGSSSFASYTHSHGFILNDGDITSSATIASGDRLVINDESSSRIINSSITFGTSTTTFLANNGTWQTPTGPALRVEVFDRDGGWQPSYDEVSDFLSLGNNSAIIISSYNRYYFNGYGNDPDDGDYLEFIAVSQDPYTTGIITINKLILWENDAISQSSSTLVSNTDTKVTQTVRSNNADYPVLLAPSGQTATTTTTANFATSLKYNPSTDTLYAGTFNGNATSATSATSATTATNANNIKLTTTNPTTGTTYYLPFTTGITSNTNYAANGNNGIRYNSLEGTTSAAGYGRLILGNATATGTAANKTGWLRIYGDTAYYMDIKGGSVTANRTVYLPTLTATGYLLGKSSTSAIGASNQLVYFSAAGVASAGIKISGGTSDPSGGSSGDIYIKIPS